MEQFITPQEEFMGRKFIQLYLKQASVAPIFRYSMEDKPTEHMTLLSNFIKEFKLEYKLVRLDDIILVIASETKDYKLVGAGNCEFRGNKLELWGGSGYYPVRSNQEHLSKIAELYPQIKFEINERRFS
jgi:hypothetical protein